MKNDTKFFFQYKNKTKMSIDYHFNNSLNPSFWSRLGLAYTLLACFYDFYINVLKLNSMLLWVILNVNVLCEYINLQLALLLENSPSSMCTFCEEHYQAQIFFFAILNGIRFLFHFIFVLLSGHKKVVDFFILICYLTPLLYFFITSKKVGLFYFLMPSRGTDAMCHLYS